MFFSTYSRGIFFFEILIFIDFIAFFVFLGLFKFLKWNTDYVQIEFLWVLWGKWSILILFYLGVFSANMCISRDIALFLVL